MNTKLLLFYSSFDRVADVQWKLQNTTIVNQACGYNFDLAMPIVDKVPVMEEYTSWWSGEKKQRVKGFNHILQFPKELNEEELKYWRWFKLGFCTCWFAPRT